MQHKILSSVAIVMSAVVLTFCLAPNASGQLLGGGGLIRGVGVPGPIINTSPIMPPTDVRRPDLGTLGGGGGSSSRGGGSHGAGGSLGGNFGVGNGGVLGGAAGSTNVGRNGSSAGGGGSAKV